MTTETAKEIQVALAAFADVNTAVDRAFWHAGNSGPGAAAQLMDAVNDANAAAARADIAYHNVNVAVGDTAKHDVTAIAAIAFAAKDAANAAYYAYAYAAHYQEAKQVNQADAYAKRLAILNPVAPV